MRERGRRLSWLAGGLAAAALVAFGARPAGADDAAECWRRFFAGIGAEERLADDLVRLRFAGFALRLPAAYLRGWRPQGELGPNDAVRLSAWPPRLAPLTREQASAPWRPGSEGVRLTLFGHPQFLHGQALLDAMTRVYGHTNREGERDANGFLVYRAANPSAAATWGEIHVWPGDPERMFHCHPSEPPWLFPQCATERWVGGTLRIEMQFIKTLLPQYRLLEASLERAMSCALDSAEATGRAWPTLPPPN